MSPNPKLKKQNQRTLILLVMAFIVPVFAAYLVYLNLQSTGPGSTKNHGTLVRPARPISQVNLKTFSGDTFTQKDLTGKWSLIYLGQGECSESCQANLAKMQQGRLAQGKEMVRIQLLYVVVNKREDINNLADKYKPLKVVTGEAASIHDFMSIFQLNSDEELLHMQRVYMVDPLGNLMMHYENGAELSGLIKDLEHLLKTSHIG